MKLFIKSSESQPENNETFNTFEVNNISTILSARRYVSNIEEKRGLADKLFAFFQDIYMMKSVDSSHSKILTDSSMTATCGTSRIEEKYLQINLI